MVAATQKTKWRRLVKKQLSKSNLPIENEMFYRQYVNVIYEASKNFKLGNEIYRIERKKLFTCLHKYLGRNPVLSLNQDLILYTAALLMDYTEGKKTPCFQGASLICGECLLPVKISNNGKRYVCPHCNAQVNAGPNRMPLGIPASQKIRSERNRLHTRLDSVMGYRKKIAILRDKYYRQVACFLDKPYELTHIGFVVNKSDVILWDLAIDHIENSNFLSHKEINHV